MLLQYSTAHCTEGCDLRCPLNIEVFTPDNTIHVVAAAAAAAAWSCCSASWLSMALYRQAATQQTG
jgi:hypothetical protein